jgi:hypothetical protein
MTHSTKVKVAKVVGTFHVPYTKNKVVGTFHVPSTESWQNLNFEQHSGVCLHLLSAVS